MRRLTRSRVILNGDALVFACPDERINSQLLTNKRVIGITINDNESTTRLPRHRWKVIFISRNGVYKL